MTTSTHKPYIIWAPPYAPESGGIRALYKLGEELVARGENVFIGNQAERDVSDYIAIYPEVISGNCFGCKTVVRWVLNHPGLLAGDTEYDPSELIFPFHRVFDHWDSPEERILNVPTLDLNLYYDMGYEKQEDIVYFGKHGPDETPETKGLNAIGKEPTRQRADILRRAGVMYSFDNITIMTTIARLCGCAVVVVPDGSMTEEQLWLSEGGPSGLCLGTEGRAEALQYLDSENVRRRYLKTLEQSHAKIDSFIRITQDYALL